MDETACEGCPSAPVLVDAWTTHILWLDSLVQAGCRYALDDLSVHEWEGLRILADERNRHQDKKAEEMKNRR